MTRNTDHHHDWTGLTAPDKFRFPPLRALVQADTACFTRPEFPSERVSYPAPTPAALAGILSSVLWKPQFRWVIDSIDVLNPIRWTTQQRNEVNVAGSFNHASSGEVLDVEQHRVQRQTLMLRDVAYRVRAHIWVHPGADGNGDGVKWRDQFHRRLQRGAYFRPPYLGMREHVADVLPDDPHRHPVDTSEALGLMLHSIVSDDATGAETYTWFHARLDHGRLTVPRHGQSLAQAAAIGTTP